MVGVLKQILPMTQAQLKSYLQVMLVRFGYEVLNQDGFLYGAGDKKILLVSHMDTVHFEVPDPLCYDKKQKIMWSPKGIGGDDRCGVAIILKLLSIGFRPHVLFTEDEEIGCVGARKAAKAIFPDVNFLVELDRRGQQDSVYYRCGNQDFKEYINSFGFVEAQGSCSDIVSLSSEWDIASVNLSVGYFNEHTKHEYIDVNITTVTMEKVRNILLDEKDEFFEHMEIKYAYNYTKPQYDGYYSEGGYYSGANKKKEEITAVVLTNPKEKFIEKMSKSLSQANKDLLEIWLNLNYPNGLDSYMVSAWMVWCDFCDDYGIDSGFGGDVYK